MINGEPKRTDIKPAVSTVPSKAELIGQAANEFFSAIARGEEPSISEYTERYPEIAEQIRRTFSALLLLRNQSAPAHKDQAGAQNDSRTLGDFRLINEIGRGGMGTVFEAEQLSMGRRVALKVLPFAAITDEQSLRRFRNEVRAAAALDHPNIVSVYSIGEDRGVHFYSMQLIRGRTLSDLISEMDGHDLSPEDHIYKDRTTLSHGSTQGSN
jgi:serine/threonine protein kinase